MMLRVFVDQPSIEPAIVLPQTALLATFALEGCGGSRKVETIAGILADQHLKQTAKTRKTLDNVFNFAIAGVYKLNARWDLLGEILATTSSLGGGMETATTPEAAGGEIVDTLGVRYHWNRDLDLFADVSFDSNQAVGLRLGLTWKF